MAVTARTLLAHRNYRLYLGCRLSAAIANQMVLVAVGWQVYALTGDPLSLGLVGLVLFLPFLLLILPAGQVADRFDRIAIIRLCIGLQVAVAAALLALSLQSAPAVTAIYAVLVLAGAARAFLAPASQSLVPLLVPPAHLAQAVALNSSAWQIAVIAGPALGGVLYLFGAPVVYGTAMALLVLAMLAVGLVEARAVERSGRFSLDGILEGVRYVMKRRIILGAVSLDLFAVLFGGATALLPIFASDILAVGPWGLGVLRSAPAVGAMAVALWLAHRPLHSRAGAKMLAAVALFGAATVVFALSREFWLSLAALAVLGAADMISVVVRQTLVQIATPDAMRGRVSAVNQVFIGASNELGEFESGVTAAWWGTVPAVVVGGLGTLAVVAIWAWRFPELRRIDRLDQAAP